uniref:hypothetical protein n=1 Tax=Sphingomonas sp. TaxID=28214 RepID=UPI00344D6B00
MDNPSGLAMAGSHRQNLRNLRRPARRKSATRTGRTATKSAAIPGSARRTGRPIRTTVSEMGQVSPGQANPAFRVPHHRPSLRAPPMRRTMS